MKRGLICVIPFFLAFSGLKAQNFLREHVFLSPSITIGYTFGAKIMYGADLDLGYRTIQANGSDIRAGISLSHYFVVVKSHTAQLTTASLLFQKDFADVKAGIGRLFNRWGYEGRNRSATYGFSYDLSLRLPDKRHNSWLGLRHFVYKPGSWLFFEIPYTTLYAKFRYNLISESPPKIAVPKN